MIDTLYIEEEIREHPRTQKVLEKFPHARKISIERFSEIFNRTAQNFRLQKQKPSLILAKKYGRCVHPLPIDHRLGQQKSFYFSALFNCLFDCSYCFLQGFFRSAHLLLFVNFEEFFQQIEEMIAQNPQERLFFFSGYESDSLGSEHISSFLEEFLPFFEQHNQSFFEIRTKSASIAPLLHRDPLENCIIAFSLTPSLISKAFEKKVPSLNERIKAMNVLQQMGWKIAIRLDPIIYFQGFEEGYQELFSRIFSQLDPAKIHSATIGTIRYPKEVYKNMRRLQVAPEILAPLFQGEENLFGYTKEIKETLLSFCEENLRRFLAEEKIFRQEKK